MTKLKSFTLILLAFFYASSATAQPQMPVKVFGYFQNTLEYHDKILRDTPEISTFMVQQLNLFLQKDLATKWTALVNFEILNNFSSSRNWGSLNLEEAWVSYRYNEKFRLKLGLQIPVFNNLNEIKNRTPLLPYIIRPLMYETSFNEIVAIEEAVPSRAFVQAQGFLSSGDKKLDYAVYLGNSANINNNPERGQTGLDTSITFLYGGRLGLRYKEVKIGVSGTYEKSDVFAGLAVTLGERAGATRQVPKTRLGGDFSFNLDRLAFESEFITADQYKARPEIDLDLDFYYATLGYRATDALFIYGSYWVANSKFVFAGATRSGREQEELKIPNVGLAYDLNEQVKLKAQFARVRIHSEYTLDEELPVFKHSFNFINAAVSVLF